MVHQPACGGGGNCAHRYVAIDGESLRCEYCGHSSRKVNHRWRGWPGGSDLCEECMALLWSSEYKER